MNTLTWVAAAAAGLVAGTAIGTHPASAADTGCPPWDVACHAAQGAKDLGGDLSDAAKKSNPFVCNDGRGCDNVTTFDGPPSGPTRIVNAGAVLHGFRSRNAPTMSCEQRGSRSFDTFGIPLTVTNDNVATIKLYWRNSGGSRVFKRILQSGDSVRYTTYGGSVWEVANYNGMCQQQFAVKPGASSAEFTVKP
ncbi:hypothetical protein BXY51_000591 [Actinoplanes cyaneus]|nr:hypothetical protein [Actinoplanes cyaneus]